MTVVVIQKGTTALYVPTNSSGYLINNKSEDTEIRILPFIKQNLIEYEWNPRRKISFEKYRYTYYDRATNTLNLPVNILPFLIRYLESSGVEVIVKDVPPNDARDISVTDNGSFEDRDYQTESIDFATSGCGMKALDMLTGAGKTLVAIKSILKVKKRALIIVLASLMSQWEDVLVAMCDVNVKIIRGNASIYNFIKNDYETDGEIFLCSIDTLRDYARQKGVYNAFPPFREFIRRMMFGVKVSDEIHLNFNANTLIDIQSDVAINIYLSASYMRSSGNSERIFRKVFPDEIRFSSTILKRKKHVNITECQYSLGPMLSKYYLTDRGYSQHKYEKYLMSRQRTIQEFLTRVLQPIIEYYYISKREPGHKLLVIVGLKDFAELLTMWFRELHPELRSVAFLHGVDDQEIIDSDVIFSTLGSTGTGRDLKGLRTVIMITSFGSDAITTQSIGRLRELPGYDTEFIYVACSSISSHKNHAIKRRPYYKEVGKSFSIVVV